MRSKIVARLRPVNFVLLTLLVFTSTDQIAAQSKDVLEGAKREGQLVFYSGIPIPDAQAVLSALEKLEGRYGLRRL